MRALDASLLAPILYTRPTLVCSAKGGMVVMTMRNRMMRMRMVMMMRVMMRMRVSKMVVWVQEVGLSANLSLTLGTKSLTTHATLLSP